MGASLTSFRVKHVSVGVLLATEIPLGTIELGMTVKFVTGSKPGSFYHVYPEWVFEIGQKSSFFNQISI